MAALHRAGFFPAASWEDETRPISCIVTARRHGPCKYPADGNVEGEGARGEMSDLAEVWKRDRWE